MADQLHRPIIWSTLEEYDNDPEVLARQGRAEWNTKPKGFAEQLEDPRLPEVQMRRRTFLKLSGFAAVLAAATGCEKPAEQILPYVTTPEEIVPGVSSYYTSTCRGCAAGCGIIAESRDGRPIKLEGNPQHPVNKGSMCARGQASLIDLYDPDRLRNPMNGGSTIQWNEADRAIGEALRAAGSRAVLLTGTLHGPARMAVVRGFLDSFPGMRHVVYDAFSGDHSGDAQPRYHFDKSRVTVLIGADPIAEGASPVEYNRGIGQMRTPRQRVPSQDHNEHVEYEMGRLYAFEPLMSLSGMNADYRYAVRSSDLLSVALALANELGVSGLPSVTAASLEGTIKLLKTGSTEEESFAAVIARVAADLRAAAGHSLVYGGGMMATTPDAARLEAVLHAINQHLGNIGETIDYSRASNQSLGSTARMAELVEEMRAGRIDALLVEGTNPAYSLPASAEFVAAMEKVKLRVSFSTHLDETAKLCQYVLPGLHYLENWGDAEPLDGILSIQQPTISPLWNNRSFEQSLIFIARAGGSKFFDVEEVAPAKPDQPQAAPTYRAITWSEFLRNTWRDEVYTAGKFSEPFDDWWFAALRKGVLELPAGRAAAPVAPRVNWSGYQPAKQNGEFELTAYAMPNTYDGRHANNPWLLELPDPVTRVAWDNFVGINPVTAKELKIKDGDIVEVTVDGQKITGPARLYPGMHPRSLAVGTGWGRTSFGNVSWNGDLDQPEGFNAFAPGTIVDGRPVYSGLAATIRKTGKSTELADVQGHNYMRWHENKLDEAPRQIVQATSLEKLNKRNNAPQPVAHIPYWENGEAMPDYWKNDDFSYDRHKWAMAIDLNACTGCNACMIACQAENNIPVVGKREVLNGREMHWIRIDRYYKGHPTNPEVAKQPMLCQHCDNAPCETVCPVIATAHSAEGLNIQAYNRCVGTRYCANNCPYKVRRFNFYEYSKFRKGPHDELGREGENRLASTPLALALNPDVTVRSKGIMEKCTFCHQRIREAKDEAKRLGRNIPDGGIQTACQQACPPKAITFGDRLNPTHHINKVTSEEYMRRGYGVLAEFNIRPNVMYLAQVMNRESMSWDVDYHELHSAGHEAEGHGEHEEHHDDAGHNGHEAESGSATEAEGHSSMILNSSGVSKS